MTTRDETKQFSDNQLSFSYWWFGHKKLLKRFLLLALMILNLALFINVSIYFIKYISERNISSWPNSMIGSAVDWPKVHDVFSPKGVLVKNSEVLAISPGVFDVMVWIENPNIKWYGQQVEYKLVFAGQKSESQTTFLLPGEEKLVFVQNFRSTDSNAINETARVIFSDIKWKYIEEANTYSLPSFEVSDIKLERLDDQTTKTRVTANIKNRSLSGFQNVKITAVVRSGDQPIAVNSASVQSFEIQDTRPIDIRFSQNIPYYTDIDLFVTADNLDRSNIL